MDDVELLVLRDVAVLDAQVEGDDVVVDVYGGPDCACASVRLSLPASQHHHVVARLRGWARTEARVTVFAWGADVTLSHMSVSR
jgi:hypothetical protein